MSVSIIRTLIFLAMVAVFVYQTRSAPSRSRKQRAFALATGAFVLLALINGLNVVGVNTDPLLLPFQATIFILFLIAVVSLYQSWRGGEMKEQMERVQQAMDSERERRDKKGK